jgi:hypothetical protein
VGGRGSRFQTELTGNCGYSFHETQRARFMHLSSSWLRAPPGAAHKHTVGRGALAAQPLKFCTHFDSVLIGGRSAGRGIGHRCAPARHRQSRGWGGISGHLSVHAAGSVAQRHNSGWPLCAVAERVEGRWRGREAVRGGHARQRNDSILNDLCITQCQWQRNRVSSHVRYRRVCRRCSSPCVTGQDTDERNSGCALQQISSAAY